MRRGGGRSAISSDGLHAPRQRSVALRAVLRERGWDRGAVEAALLGLRCPNERHSEVTVAESRLVKGGLVDVQQLAPPTQWTFATNCPGTAITGDIHRTTVHAAAAAGTGRCGITGCGGTSCRAVVDSGGGAGGAAGLDHPSRGSSIGSSTLRTSATIVSLLSSVIVPSRVRRSEIASRASTSAAWSTSAGAARPARTSVRSR